jgi:hypothetical protein
MNQHYKIRVSNTNETVTSFQSNSKDEKLQGEHSDTSLDIPKLIGK